MRGLAKAPDQRYATALEMQHDLETVAREKQMTLAPTSLATVMTTLFPGGQDLKVTGADTVTQGTVMDSPTGSFAEGLSAANALGVGRASIAALARDSGDWETKARQRPSPIPDSDLRASSDARISRAATADAARTSRARRPFFWYGIASVVLLFVGGVGAFGLQSTLGSGAAPKGLQDQSAVAEWASMRSAPLSPAPASASVSPEQAPAPSKSSALPDGLAGANGAASCADPTPPPKRTAKARPNPPRTSVPPTPKTTPTWDYDSPLPP